METERLTAEMVEEKATTAAQLLINELISFNDLDGGSEPVYNPVDCLDWFASGFAQLLGQKFVVTPSSRDHSSPSSEPLRGDPSSSTMLVG